MKNTLLWTTLFSLVTGPAFAANLTVSEYVGQVQDKGVAFRSSELKAEGQMLLRSLGSLVTSPFLFGDLRSLDDKQETLSPSFSGTRTKGEMYTIGVGMITPVGLDARYSFNLSHADIQNASLLPIPNYYTNYNKIELTQSLFRNGFGSETRARADLAYYSHEAQGLGEQYRQLAMVAEAEQTYWRLALARQTIKVQEDALARSDRLLSWAKRRTGLQLGDRADLLQAQANHDLSQIELRRAIEEEKNASRAFNLLRNLSSEGVPETVKFPTADEIQRMQANRVFGKRLDLQAAEATEKATVANVQLEKEQLKPRVDVFANVAWNGRDAKRPAAMEEARKSTHGTTGFGVTFNVPLEVGTLTKGLRGANLTQEAASYELELKRLNTEREWSDIQSQLAEARTRVELLQKLEEVQREKNENERQRLLRGRTTTYQSVTFEQEYATTQLQGLRARAEVLRLMSQANLFQDQR